jgi:hypothetical protein
VEEEEAATAMQRHDEHVSTVMENVGSSVFYAGRAKAT